MGSRRVPVVRAAGTRVGETHSTAAGSSRGRATLSQRPLCRVDVLTLIVEVDAAVAEWETPSTVLHALARHGWRPQDCATIDDMCRQLERWNITAVEVLGDGALAVGAAAAVPVLRAAVHLPPEQCCPSLKMQTTASL